GKRVGSDGHDVGEQSAYWVCDETVMKDVLASLFVVVVRVGIVMVFDSVMVGVEVGDRSMWYAKDGIGDDEPVGVSENEKRIHATPQDRQ
ncbi:16564_t:CDS:2, partial [Acaulospora colombiana]